ncbi:MAG: cytochrome c4 [Gammaproteobacteria bacterium]|nr:cytochrome c4 [Gammaproteobacteria bacterium]
MKKLFLAGLMFLFATSGSALAGNAEAGKTKSAACGGCHGADGNSPVPTFPKLAGQNEAYIVKQVKDFKANDTRKNEIMFGMVAALSDEDAADIGAYFQAQSLKDAAVFDAAKIAAGRDLYKGGDLQKGIPACQACHGPKGSGTAGIGYPQLGGQYVGYTLAQLKAFKDGTRKNDDKKLMRSIVEKMSDEDMAAVANYIASLK